MFFVYVALFAAILAAVLIRLYWGELDAGQRIYALAFTVVYLLSLIYVPFRIPTSGAVVYAFAWQRVEYPDETAQKILTPEVIAQVEKENPQSISKDWVRNSVMRQAPVFWYRIRIQQIVLVAFGVAGWFAMPPLITRLLAWRPRRRTSGAARLP